MRNIPIVKMTKKKISTRHIQIYCGVSTAWAIECAAVHEWHFRYVSKLLSGNVWVEDWPADEFKILDYIQNYKLTLGFSFVATFFWQVRFSLCVESDFERKKYPHPLLFCTRLRLHSCSVSQVLRASCRHLADVNVWCRVLSYMIQCLK